MGGRTIILRRPRPHEALSWSERRNAGNSCITNSQRSPIITKAGVGSTPINLDLAPNFLLLARRVPAQTTVARRVTFCCYTEAAQRETRSTIRICAKVLQHPTVRILVMSARIRMVFTKVSWWRSSYIGWTAANWLDLLSISITNTIVTLTNISQCLHA